MMDSVVWILNRNDGSVAGKFGHAGHCRASFTACTWLPRIRKAISIRARLRLANAFRSLCRRSKVGQNVGQI